MASYFVLGSDNREYGPVTIDVLKQWFGEGRLVAETQLREENSQIWKAAREFPEVAAFVLPRISPVPRPSPIATAPVDEFSQASEPVESLEGRDYQVQIGKWIGDSWQFYKSSWGEILGFTLLIMVLQVAASSIPCVGGLASLFVNPMLQVGLIWYLLKRKRGQPTDLMDLFVGFKHFYVPSLVAALLLFLIMLAVVIPVGAVIFGVAMVSQFTSPQDLQPVHWVLFAAIGFIALVVVIYLNIVFAFWSGLVPDRQLGGWEALQTSRRLATKHWLGILAYFVVVGLIVISGILACGIGLLFTIPLGACCYVTAYDAIFGPRESSTPPS